ncbi:hypothetical protein GCM10007199_19040 [Fictibacillus barbaricus]|nr:hypothetical protein GCM10007199_19040 [Fictibacillus barbaricus]
MLFDTQKIKEIIKHRYPFSFAISSNYCYNENRIIFVRCNR